MSKLFDIEQDILRQQQLFGRAPHSPLSTASQINTQPQHIIETIVNALITTPDNLGNVFTVAQVNSQVRDRYLTALLTYGINRIRPTYQSINNNQNAHRRQPAGQYQSMLPALLTGELRWAKQLLYDVRRAAPALQALELTTLQTLIDNSINLLIQLGHQHLID